VFPVIANEICLVAYAMADTITTGSSEATPVPPENDVSDEPPYVSWVP
jgi:hypothetical protein